MFWYFKFCGKVSHSDMLSGAGSMKAMENTWMLFFVCWVLVFGLEVQLRVVEGGWNRGMCRFPAIYNFGDSNSDTGGRSAALGEITSPNGETFFGHPAGRACDGRLIVDFISEHLQMPYLDAYLDSVGTNFRHGANFATGGSSISPPGYSPFHLQIQIQQFIQFKARTTAIYQQLILKGRRSNLPRPEEFSKSLYIFDIGQNDLSYGLEHTNEKETRASIPGLLNNLSDEFHMLYNEGARFFWVHNTGPLGCLPYSVIYDKQKPSNLDEIGCVKFGNELAMEFNAQLKDKISALRAELPSSVFTYVDVYTAKYSIITRAKDSGLMDPFDFCCGSYYGYHINCGKKATVNGTVYGNSCDRPDLHVSWDGIHYSETANRLVADRITFGSVSDPPRPVESACYDFHPETCGFQRYFFGN